MNRSTLVRLLLLPAALAFVACGDDDPKKPAPDTALADTGTDDVEADTAIEPDAQPDVAPDAPAPDTTPDVEDVGVSDADDAGTDTGDDTTPDDAGGDTSLPIPGTQRVDIDLAPWIAPVPGATGTVAITRAEAANPIPGELAEGLPGDYLLTNDQARFLVAFGNEVVSPCSRDGNILDAELRNSPDWARQGDVMGEICMLLNLGQTFAPKQAEIIADGSEGYAVLALTGLPETLDFLNLRQMVNDYVPGLITQFPVDPDRSPPITITAYYILRPGDPAVRVVYAFRNDGPDLEHFVVSNMIMSGSTGGYFNPLGGTGGFGYRSLGLDNLATSPVPFVVYRSDHSSYAFVPDPDSAFRADYPAGAGAVAISGVMVASYKVPDVLATVLANPRAVPNRRDYLHLASGQTATLTHRTFVGDGRISTVVDAIWPSLGVPTGRLSGRVLYADGQAAAGATVTALDAANRAVNQTLTNADGTWAMRAPTGDIRLRARFGPSIADADDPITVSDDGTHSTDDLRLGATGLLRVQVRTPGDAPIPARISILCEGACPTKADAREVETSMQPPGAYERIVSTGVDGNADIVLAPGRYRVMVSRGMTWSTWPADAVTTTGQLIEIDGGETEEFRAEIAQVVDTSGTLSGDFHVHAMTSSDSNVPNEKRVLDFLGEGVDVLVATDHDYISDFAPAINALGAGDFIASVIGAEITTPNIGHFNAFPLLPDPAKRRGGPVDWSNGNLPNLVPADLYAAANEHPGEQVIQINHPSSTMGPLKVDLLTGVTLANRDDLRMPPAEPDPITGDTGLWSDGFTAMEIMNGHGRDGFWAAFRWWLTMVGRGFSPTATAVSDTHNLYGDLGGTPRSFTFVAPGRDTPATLDVPAFVSAVNAGRLLGTNGPFFRVELENADGDLASLGDTIETLGQAVTARVTIETAEWVRVQHLDLYLNVTDDLWGEPGESLTTPLAPTTSIEIPWEPTDLEVVATGAVEHRRWKRTIEIPIEALDDAWLVFVVRGEGEGSAMYPVLNSRGPRPLAFSNPVYLDADGGGWDNPPLAELRLQSFILPQEFRFQHVSPRTEEPVRPLTPEDIGILIERSKCSHGSDPDHTHHGHDHTHPGHHAPLGPLPGAPGLRAPAAPTTAPRVAPHRHGPGHSHGGRFHRH